MNLKSMGFSLFLVCFILGGFILINGFILANNEQTIDSNDKWVELRIGNNTTKIARNYVNTSWFNATVGLTSPIITWNFSAGDMPVSAATVSYTHLTLPTTERV